jgi:hypothetical protein
MDSIPGKGKRLFARGSAARGMKPNHSHPSSAEVKNDWRYTSSPPYVFMVWIIKDGDNSTFII